MKAPSNAIIKFEPFDSFIMAGRTVFTGPCPLDGLSDTTNIRKCVGRRVEIAGKNYEILDIETHDKLPPPGLGEAIGIIVGDALSDA